MSELPRLYVVPIAAHEAKGLRVSEICWGSCGHGLIGGVNLDNDSAIPCIQPAAKCPAFDKELSEPSGTVNDGIRDDRPVYLRRLKLPLRIIRPTLRERLRAAWLKIRYAPWQAKYALREWWTPTCKDCGWPMKEHKPRAPLTGDEYFDREGLAPNMRLRAYPVSNGIFFELDEIDCRGNCASLLFLYSDAEALRDALGEYLEKNK